MSWPEARIEDFDAAVREIALAGRSVPKHDKIFWAGRLFNKTCKTLLAQAKARPGLFVAIDTEGAYDSAGG